MALEPRRRTHPVLGLGLAALSRAAVPIAARKEPVLQLQLVRAALKPGLANPAVQAQAVLARLRLAVPVARVAAAAVLTTLEAHAAGAAAAGADKLV